MHGSQRRPTHVLIFAYCPNSGVCPASVRRLSGVSVGDIFTLVLLSLLLFITSSAQAQGYYSLQPCDALGNPLQYPQQDNYGYYLMTGTQSGKIVSTYPPGATQTYTNSFVGNGSFQAIGAPGTSGIIAGNDYPGPINGSVVLHLSGPLVYYFKATWIGSGTPVGYIDLLLRPTLVVSANANYGGSLLNSGLSAKATAVDGFETTTMTAGDAGTSPGYSQVVGYHLVRSAVAPATGIAEVYLNGTSDITVINNVPFSAGNQSNNNTASAAGLAWVQAGVRQDSRDVTITCPTIETSYMKGPVDTLHPTGQWPNLCASNGSLSTDSAVSPPLTQPGAPTADWTASDTLLGVASGFQNPTFAWIRTGTGSLSSSGNVSNTQLSVKFPVSSTAPALKQRSYIQLDVTDSDGTTGANNYTILWHYPYENWVAFGAQFQNSPIAYPSSTGPQDVGGQVSIPVKASGFQWDVAGKIGGGFASVGTSLIGILAPETDPIIIGFMNSAGYGLSVINSPPTPQPYIEPGTPAEFQADVATQIAINHSNTSGIFLSSRARMDPALATAVNAAGNYGTYTSDTGGALTFDVTAYQEQMQQNYTGDSYGQNGYLGPAAGSTVFGGPWMYVWDWIWTPTVSPPTH